MDCEVKSPVSKDSIFTGIYPTLKDIDPNDSAYFDNLKRSIMKHTDIAPLHHRLLHTTDDIEAVRCFKHTGPSKRFYFVRHGETDLNLTHRVQGSGVDPPLNCLGAFSLFS